MTHAATTATARGADALRRPCLGVSQPMYFPWIGMLEQARLCDEFVHYDDVQFVRRGFTQRVQVKTRQGPQWLTVPLRDVHRGQTIDEVRLDESSDWRGQHRDTLRHAHADAPFRDDMLALVDGVLGADHATLADLSIASLVALCAYFGIDTAARGRRSSALGVPGASTQRLVDLCTGLGAGTYLTGHGARNYLEYELFEARGIDVAYIAYDLGPWPQAHGGFTPYVSALDLVARCGRAGAAHILGRPVGWREFLTSGA